MSFWDAFWRIGRCDCGECFKLLKGFDGAVKTGSGYAKTQRASCYQQRFRDLLVLTILGNVATGRPPVFGNFGFGFERRELVRVD